MPSDEASQTGAHTARTGPPTTSIPRSEDSLAQDATSLDAARQTDGSNSVLGRISSQMAAIERRDAELWTIVVLTSTLIAAGLLATLAPAAFSHGPFKFEITVPKEAFLGLIAIIALSNVYLVSRRMELRKTRQAVIATTIQSELMRLQSFTDPLTEVYNRRSLTCMVCRYISHARRLHAPLTFLLIDVDRFKDVNSRFGHLTGDLVLVEVATLLKSSVRGSDAVIRYGGDEFLVILADATREGAKLVENRIHRFVEDWNHRDQLKNFTIRLSIGVAEWEEGKSVDQILDTADRNMYAAKGKQKVTIRA